MRIAVDVLGGDHAPNEIIAGVALALEQSFPPDGLLLVGPEQLIREKMGSGADCPEIINTEVRVEGEESPAEALRSKTDSSIRLCVDAVARGAASGLVSFGNTGATVVASAVGLGLLPGIKRSGIAVSLQGVNGRFVMVDAGANPSPKPEHLFHYGLMGRAYAQDILNAENPSLGLLNIGGEASKGNTVLKETHALLEASNLPFHGNIEGNQIFEGNVDVIIADGFSGNTVIKVLEGFGEFLMAGFARLGDEASDGEKSAFRSLLGVADYTEVGGAILLGVQGTVVVGHGRSEAKAVPAALFAARDEVEKEVNQHIVEAVSEYSQEATSSS